jgi:hypothetical protein
MLIRDRCEDIFLEHLEETIRVVWLEAVDNAKERDEKTVQPEDIRNAYKSLFEPHETMRKASQQMEKYQNEFEEEAMSESPILKNIGDS